MKKKLIWLGISLALVIPTGNIFLALIVAAVMKVIDNLRNGVDADALEEI